MDVLQIIFQRHWQASHKVNRQFILLTLLLTVGHGLLVLIEQLYQYPPLFTLSGACQFL